MNLRSQIFIFVVSTLAVSWGYEAFILTHGGVKTFGLIGLVALMWIPGALSIAFRIIFRTGFGDVGFSLGKLKFYVYGILVPIALAVFTNLISSVFDIRHFEFVDQSKLPRAMPMVAMSLVFGVIGALGEELGWRGYLLPKMVAARISKPYLLSGLIWAAWHLPIITLGDYYAGNDHFLIAIAYALSIVAMGFLMSELRMQSGSVWVATAFHASHNFFFQLVVPNLFFTKLGNRSDLWEIVGGDCGFTVALLYTFAFLLYKRFAR